MADDSEDNKDETIFDRAGKVADEELAKMKAKTEEQAQESDGE